MNEQCKKGLHDYKAMETRGDKLTSKCRLCGKVIQENAKDNRNYLENHKRDFLQRGDRDYKMVYGENNPFEKKVEYTDEELMAEEQKKWQEIRDKQGGRKTLIR